MRKMVSKIGLFFVLSIAMLLFAALSFAAIETNKIISMQMDSVNGSPALRIVTEKPIGYRFTIYDSTDPVRVVVNFPHMDIDAVSSLTDVNQLPARKVDVSSHDLVWGQMGRVEIVLSEMADYDVTTNGNEFLLTLLLKTDQVTTTAVEPVLNETEPVAPPLLMPVEESTLTSTVVPAPAMEKAASKIINVDVGEQVVTLQADGLVDNYKFFSLGGPERLVVDVYSVKPGFGERSFPLPGDFSRMRVGVYKKKLRFVFDSSGKLPEYAVTSSGESVVIRWGAGTSTATNHLQ